jgi:hypothetical protein
MNMTGLHTWLQKIDPTNTIAIAEQLPARPEGYLYRSTLHIL